MHTLLFGGIINSGKDQARLGQCYNLHAWPGSFSSRCKIYIFSISINFWIISVHQWLLYDVRISNIDQRQKVLWRRKHKNRSFICSIFLQSKHFNSLTSRLFCSILYAAQNPDFHHNISPPFRSALFTETKHADLDFQIYFKFWHLNVKNIYPCQRISSYYQKWNASLRKIITWYNSTMLLTASNLNHSFLICAGFIPPDLEQ